MNLTTIAVDLAKDVFEVAVADRRYQIVEPHRLTRSQFERFFRQRERSLWVMEACGGAHHWAHTLQSGWATRRSCCRRRMCVPTT